MTALTRDDGLALLRDMVRVRRLEERCAELYTQTKIRGFLHLYIGEEAVATGVTRVLAPDDAVVATYREHGHALLKGISANAIMAEMYGKQEGCSRGRGGSMHLFNAATRFYGGNAIVGGGLPLAVGLALADRMRGLPRVTCCFFGDGAAAEGVFHESLNLAVLWQLPVLFVCENNLYAMGTALRYSHAATDLASRAAGYGLPSVAVDGMDVLAVEEAARAACESVRDGHGPYFLEARTYRFRAHSMFDPELYRSKAEVAEWKKRDPIVRLTAQLREAGLVSEADLDAILVHPGAKVPVGTVLARVRGPGEVVGGRAAAGRIKATPVARRMAAELGLDLATIRGSGPGGAVDRADVERVAALARQQAAAPTIASLSAPPIAPPTASPIASATAGATAPEAPAAAPADQLRQAIAAAMARSNREIPHYFLQTSIDMQPALAWLRDENVRRTVGDRLLVAALLVKAVAKAAAAVPELNGYWTDGRLDARAQVHVGLAVALRRGGLIAPALHDVGTKTLDEVMRAMNDLIGRARAGRLRSSEMADATITVTNLGDLGVESVFGVIYPPQVALVGFGRIADRPWAMDGLLGVRPILTATIAADHRATDGRQGARFLDAIGAALAHPESL